MKHWILFNVYLGCLLLQALAIQAETKADATDKDDWRDPKLEKIAITVPPFEGERYKTMAPDTLDLTERAALCINAITRLVNPEWDYAQYTYADLRHDPPYLIMEAGITNLNPKWLEALPLLRNMTGNTFNADVDHHILEGILHNTGFDGLTYQPPDHPGAFYEDFSRKQNQPAANIFGEGRQLLTWAVWAQADPGNPVYRYVAENKIKRLLEIAVKDDAGLHFRRTQGYTPGQKDTDKLEVVAVTDHDVKDSCLGMVGTAVAHSVSPVAMGAGRYYRATGHEPALKLARGMAEYFRKKAGVIDETGRWHGYHFHIITTGVLGQLEYALAAKDDDMLQWVRRAYEYGRSIGDPTLGFFAGVPGCPDKCKYNPNAEECGKDKDRMMVEPCTVADMALIALQLTRAGAGDYYEDVEHYVRNFLVETQFTDLDQMKDYPKELSQSEQMKNQFKATMGKHPDPRKVSHEGVAEKSLGSFCCATPNQWFHSMPGPNFCGCCLGNGARVLYYVWDSILDDGDGELRVNLLLNRASPTADINSYLPYGGKVVVKLKQDRDVLVRIPSWTNWKDVRCSVDGRAIPVQWSGSYIKADNLKSGEALTMEFPMTEKTLYRSLRGKDFVITTKGYTVLDVQPHADVTPIFRREYYKQAKAPMREVERFVSTKSVKW